jgi:hypothetical protein
MVVRFVFNFFSRRDEGGKAVNGEGGTREVGPRLAGLDILAGNAIAASGGWDNLFSSRHF